MLLLFVALVVLLTVRTLPKVAAYFALGSRR